MKIVVELTEAEAWKVYEVFNAESHHDEEGSFAILDKLLNAVERAKNPKNGREFYNTEDVLR